ncbi:hydroxyisourate hydrolase [Natronosporangium hydrolyticum]|uniref:Hydroxyisourate hydrolase n=1 Tax=Natronosporangium hydrolyticum TaxID=2811111 RepID=A0A895Y5D6_9ACTN|nr:hydroxyisourate hydrolase [Natronosporangium hydrolyticum]QSB12897.1 hydroxyisourate hydrolase [Natronosporangium hydrolyticum]
MGISIEVIDSATGRSAIGASFVLWRKETDWQELAKGQVARAGQQQAIRPPTPDGSGTRSALERGMYRLRIDLDPYFAGLGVAPFQSHIEVAFRVFHCGQQIRFLMMITPTSCDHHIVLSDDRPPARSSQN